MDEMLLGMFVYKLKNQGVNLNNAEKEQLNNILEALNFDEEKCGFIFKLIEMVGYANYRLGADREKERLVSYFKGVVDEIK